MASQEYINKQMASLTKEDWQYIHMAVQNRVSAASPQKGEPPASKAFKEQTSRILTALMTKAYS